MKPGLNSGMYVPSAPSRHQDPNYLQTQCINWNLYAGKPKCRLLKQVMAEVGIYITWNSDHFAQKRAYDFRPSAPIKTSCKFCTTDFMLHVHYTFTPVLQQCQFMHFLGCLQ